PFTGGMLVAAPYPLGRTAPQPGAPRLLFPTTTTEGVYNALIALLNYDDAGKKKPGTPLTATLLDYSDPFCSGACSQPPVWISVVGRSRPRELWRSARSSDYTFNATRDESEKSAELRVAVGHAPFVFWSLVAVLLAVLPIGVRTLWHRFDRGGSTAH